jgi:hypothetical protein
MLSAIADPTARYTAVWARFCSPRPKTRMLIGPAIGIEVTKPRMKPINEAVNIRLFPTRAFSPNMACGQAAKSPREHPLPTHVPIRDPRGPQTPNMRRSKILRRFGAQRTEIACLH